MLPQRDLIINQGGTFQRTFHWFAGTKRIAELEQVTPGFPTIITVTGHGLPSGVVVPMSIEGVRGMPALNSKPCSAFDAEYVTDDTFKIPVNTLGREWKSPSGGATWFELSDLTDFTARMQIRETLNSTETLAELTTENGGITLSVADAGVQILITDTITAGFDFDYAVYDIELIGPAPDSIVYPFIGGNIALQREVTR